ncbi:hypothetical protein C5S31_08375 [ANME-1 cluster archaeon GoMg2]|nr:hypothetical protein [ANME-1 cluster archaeon GoMg2]
MWFKNLKRFAASTDAQAFAIGAVILIMIAVTATTIYLSINAPIETKECEFLHSTEVTDDFVALNSTISSLIHAESSVAYNSVPIKLTPTKESFIALPLASGTLSFSPNKGNISVRLSETGDGSPGIWTLDNFTGNYSLKYGNVNDTTGNLTLSGPPYASACIESDMTNGHIGNDTESNSTVYGNITWHALTSPPATEIIMKVRTALDANMIKSTPWMEVENGTNLSTIFPTLNGHRYVQLSAELITWEPSKTPTLINVSINYSHKNVIFANTSGNITFKSSYHYFPNQVITYENGAVIKSQDDQEFVRSPFNISFQNVSNNRTRIKISLVNLTGASEPGRAGAATLVRLLRIENKTVSNGFFYSNLTITVNSGYSHGIRNWFNKTLEELNSSYYNVTANHTTGMVEIELYAKEQEIELYLEEATISVEM